MRLRKRKRYAVGLSAVGVLGGIWLAATGATAQKPPQPPTGNMGALAAHEFSRFKLFAVRDGFDNLPISARIRVNRPSAGGPVRSDFVSFIYGWCAPSDGMGCAPSLEIQNWPACERNPSVYSPLATDGAQTLSLRGVPAMYFGHLGRPRLELSVADTTVVIFGSTRGQVVRAAQQLEGVNNSVRAPNPLPRPMTGAVAGTLECAW
jgi:hypothetical protein